MRKTILSAGLLLLMANGLVSCSKHKDDIAPAPEFSSNAAMDGTVSGTAWIASSLNAGLSVYGNSHELAINGWQQGNDETVYITIRPYDFVAGTFYIGPGQPSTAFYQHGPNGIASEDNAKSGKVVIYFATADTVKGTYEFTTVANVSVSGKFTVIPVK